MVHKTAALVREATNASETPCAIGLIFEPTVESVIGMMGVLASGNFFCPISPNDPTLRIADYLEDADIVELDLGPERNGDRPGLMQLRRKRRLVTMTQ